MAANIDFADVRVAELETQLEGCVEELQAAREELKRAHEALRVALDTIHLLAASRGWRPTYETVHSRPQEPRPPDPGRRWSPR